MRGIYSRTLKVSTPDGQRIIAVISRSGNKPIIEIPYLEVVKKDNPPFASNGVIRFSCEQKNYSNVIATLTQYLEDLFLKGMSNESVYTGLGVKPKSRRTKKSDLPGEIKGDSREGGSSSLHTSARRNKQTKDSRPRSADNEMAESSDSEISSDN